MPEVIENRTEMEEDGLDEMMAVGGELLGPGGAEPTEGPGVGDAAAIGRRRITRIVASTTGRRSRRG